MEEVAWRSRCARDLDFNLPMFRKAVSAVYSFSSPTTISALTYALHNELYIADF